MCCLISASVICTFLLTLVLSYPLFLENTKQEVKDESVYLVYIFNHGRFSSEKLSQVARTQTRITWINSDGIVLFDNDSETNKMENHLLRPEVQSALKDGTGEAYRISTTVGSNTYYYAVKLNDGTVLRLARSNVSAYDMLSGALPTLLVMMFAIYAVSLLAAQKMAHKLIRPMNSINLEHPIMNNIYEELNPHNKQYRRRADHHQSVLQNSSSQSQCLESAQR